MVGNHKSQFSRGFDYEITICIQLRENRNVSVENKNNNAISILVVSAHTQVARRISRASRELSDLYKGYMSFLVSRKLVKELLIPPPLPRALGARTCSTHPFVRKLDNGKDHLMI